MPSIKKNLFFILSLGLSFFAIIIVIQGLFTVFDLSGWQPILELIRLPFSSTSKFLSVIKVWLPLMLVLASVLFAFQAGFWNIGVEGQIVMGAISATYLIRLLQTSTIAPVLVIITALIFGAIGGGLWAFISALLKTESGLHEIISGIGLNVFAFALSNWLVIGPWRRLGSGSLGGTDMINQVFWLPEIGSLPISYLVLILVLIIYFGISFLLRRTRFGLHLAAFHLNPNAKYINASFTSQRVWRTFLYAGLLSGLTGAMLVLATYHRLIPSITSGMGYTALLIALMVYQQPIWAVGVAFIFSMANINSSQLAMQYQLPSSIVGVFQAGWVLFMLVIYQSFERMFRARE